MLQEDHRAIVADGRLEKPFDVVGCRGGDDLESGSVEEDAFHVLGVKQAASYSAAVRHSDDQGYLEDAVAPVAGSRCFTDELVHGGPDEIGKLDLGDGAHTPECGPKSYPHDGRFGQGGIDDPRFAELIYEALSG